MEQTIKEIRVKIDGLFKITATLKPSREIALAKTHFEEAKMSLGKVLGYLGAANPYPESKNPENKVIEKTADTEDRNLYFQDPNNHIGNVKLVRKDADDIAKEIEVILDQEAPNGLHQRIPLFFIDAFMQTHKGMMWLGMELGRIKSEEDKKALEDMPQSPNTKG